MPGATPVLGLPYPYETEPITVADFAALANAIDAAQAATQVMAQATLTGRPLTRVLMNGGQTSGSGATMTVTWQPTTPVQVDNMYNPAANDRITANTAGFYLINANSFFLASGFTTVDALEVFILVNGVIIGAERQPGSFGSSGPLFVSATVMYPLGLGSIVQIQASWTGTGGPATWSPFGYLGASYICPLV